MESRDLDPRAIDRREAIRRVSFMLGGASLVGGSSLLAACESGERPASGAEPTGDFTTDDIALLDEIADTILPETGTPGAKAAAVGAFMALMVTDTYRAPQQDTFRAGMTTLNQECVQETGVEFMDATPVARLALLKRIDREAHDYEEARDSRAEDDPGPHYFRMMKQLTLLGYFTSEIGCTQAQRYRESPGRYDPCVPYAPGEASWAGHA